MTDVKNVPGDSMPAIRVVRPPLHGRDHSLYVLLPAGYCRCMRGCCGVGLADLLRSLGATVESGQ